MPFDPIKNYWKQLFDVAFCCSVASSASSIACRSVVDRVIVDRVIAGPATVRGAFAHAITAGVGRSPAAAKAGISTRAGGAAA